MGKLHKVYITCVLSHRVIVALMLMIDTYIQTFWLWYDYKLEQRQQIIAKLKRQVMRAFNITIGYI